MNRTTTALLLIAAFSFPVAVAATGLTPKTENGIHYLSGGIGQEERAAMEAEGKNYNLKLGFSQKDGAYIADVKVAIDSGRKHWVEAVSEGPFFYAKLPTGKYRITATYLGKSQTRMVDVGQNTAHLFFRWAE